MYIPKRTKEDTPWLPLIPLKEGKNTTPDNSMLLEAAHAFDEQYKWAWNCAEFTYSAILENQTKLKVRFKNNKDTSLNGAIIFPQANNLFKTSASIYDVTDDGWVKININANKNLIARQKELAVLEIWDAIVHEMGHGNIYWKKMTKSDNTNDIPDDYEKWGNVMKDANIMGDDVAYLFCYALYSTYYQEIQAFISQTYTNTVMNLKRMYGRTDNITKQQFWNAIIRTNTYQTFNSNIEMSEKILTSDKSRNMLRRRLEDYNIFYSDTQIVKMCENIKEKSNDALKAAYNNVYQWFYKSFKD